MSKAVRILSILFALVVVLALSGAAALAEESAAPDQDYQAPRLLPESKAVFQMSPPSRRSVGDTVLLFQAIVLKDGTIGTVELLNDDRPYPGVEKAAVDTLRRWRYQPAQLGGQPVDAGVTISLQFRGAGALATTRPAEAWLAKPGGSQPMLGQVVFPGGGGPKPANIVKNIQKAVLPTCQAQFGSRCMYNTADFQAPSRLVGMPIATDAGGLR
jgi:TonB family protein